MKNSSLNLTAFVLAAAMLASSAGAAYLKPDLYLADTRAQLLIEPSLPQAFGDWKLQPVSRGVVNPQTETLLNTLYSEVISRTYANARGERVMLSIAYGKNQNDSFQVHKPEICYPAQGFQVKSNRAGEMNTPFGSIPVRRVETMLGSQRPEPVTYWTTLGDESVRSGTDKKLKEMRHALRGYIADGLLFRVSSVDADSMHAFEVHEHFVSDLLAALKEEDRRRIAGLGS